jgi:hypothetical protein
MHSYETLDPPAEAAPDTMYYKITDTMHTLPKGLWDTTVCYNAAITNIENGVKWLIHAPLGIVQRSSWTVEPVTEADDAGDSTLCLVEVIDISCSRLLIGTVRSKHEEHWKTIHVKWVEYLEAVDVDSASVKSESIAE